MDNIVNVAFTCMLRTSVKLVISFAMLLADAIFDMKPATARQT